MLAGQQRRGLAVRKPSQLNVDAQQNYEKKGLVNLKKPASSNSPAPVAFKKPALTCAPSIQKKPFGGNHFMVSEEMATDIDRYLQTIQRTRKLEPDYLTNTKIDGRMRAILLDWVIQIQAKFKLTAESFYLACCILDRIVEPMAVSRKELQLVGLACIFTASKFEEVMIPNVHDFVYMGGDFCTVESLFAAERNILRAIEFQLTFAYPNHFLRKLRFHMPTNDQSIIYELCKILVDVVFIDHKMAVWLPSEMAAAATIVAYGIIQRNCPKGLIETIDVQSSAASDKANILRKHLPAYLQQQTKLKGLRLKYKGTAALKHIDEAMPRLGDL